jgi:diguanylate cyclase (GGDEF)-like protein
MSKEHQIMKLHNAARSAGAQDPGIAAGDCDSLFTAVLERLRHVAADPAPEPVHGQPAWRTGIAECTDALAQLQLAMSVALARQVPVEHELAAARAELANTQCNLEATRVEERRARHRAAHDELTSLPNRAHFRAQLDHVLASGQWPQTAPASAHYPALAVLYVDLDGFKAINDQHGHATGDALLRIIAARLRHSMRAEDLVCRLGGDEFACLMANALSREKLQRMACQLFDAVAAPLRVGALELTVRPSIGIAVCPGDGCTTASLLDNADAAMYSAKRHQMGYAFFDGGASAP